MRYELINPSDPYFFDAPDLEIAAVLACVLGGGHYPADPQGDDANKGINVPAFLFGGHDEWFTAKFGRGFEATLDHACDTRAEEFATALDSLSLAPGRQRTSLNNIKARAQAFSNALRTAASSSQREQEGGRG